jgi:tetratricopeptide (TPR) repeat protein
MELGRPLNTPWRPVRGPAITIERVIAVSSWMMVLGTIRLIAACADYTNTFLDASRFQPFSYRLASDFLHENNPVFVLSAAWPLLVALWLRRTRWPELLAAAALTFLFLSIGGTIESTAEWRQAQSNGETIGSFHLTRRAFLHPTFSDLALLILGATQLMLEFVTAGYALLLAAGFRGSAIAECSKQDRSRRARWGRLAVYGAIGYLVLMVRLPVWSTYIEVLNNSTIFREFIIQNDMNRIRGTGPPRRYARTDERFMRTRAMMTTALQATVLGQFALAKENYNGVIAIAEGAPSTASSRSYQTMVADALNNLAWLQATCPEMVIRDPPKSVTNARRAVELEPENGNFWNTLGTACYRNGNWVEADRALARSMELRNGGDGFDWFVLALVQLKLGHRDDALRWYGQGVDWYHKFMPLNRELYRFQAEAAKELGLAPPSPPPRKADGRLPRLFPFPSSSAHAYELAPRPSATIRGLSK